MAGNTEVGRGYVKLEINGDGMNDDIVDAVDSAGPGVGKAGEEHGDKYGEGFEEGFFDRITATLSKGLEKELDKDFKNMGRRLGNSLSKSISASMDSKLDEIEVSVARMVDNLENRIKDVSGNGGGGGRGGAPTPGGTSGGGEDDRRLIEIQQSIIQKLLSTAEKNRIALHEKANADIEKADRELVKTQQAILDSARKAQQAMEKENADVARKFAEKRVKMQEASNLAIEKDDERSHKELLKSQQALMDTLKKNHAAMEKENASIAQKFAEARVKMQVASNLAIEKDNYRLFQAEQKALYQRLRNEETERKKTSRRGSDRTMGDRIGGLFGAGSRSNVLNLLGKSMGNIINLAGKAGTAALSMGATFTKGFTSAAEGASTLQKTIGGMAALGSRAGAGVSAAFSSIAASGPAAAGAAIVVGVALSALVSIVGALLALTIALTATIVAGLTAGLAVLGGTMVAVIAAGGLLTAAFMSMTDAQKTLLKDAFRPLREEMVGIGQIMISEMVPAFGVWSSNLQRAIQLVTPLAQTLGKTFADAGSTITASLSGPGFQKLADSLGVWLPSIIANLSSAFGQFLNGATAVFAALMPYVDRFSGYLDRLATRFSMWANSVGGQNAIADFMDRALVSLQSLWDAVREFSGVIGDLLFSPEAMGAGNTIFDGLARTFASLRDEIAKAAANGDLQRWFDDAIEFGGQLWGVIQALISVFQALYSSGVLGAVGDALGVLATVLDWVARIISNDFVGAVGSALPSALAASLSPIFALVDAISSIGGAIDWVMQKIGLAEAQSARSLGNIMANIGRAAGLTASAGSALGIGGAIGAGTTPRPVMPTIPKLIGSGQQALAGTNIPKVGGSAGAAPKYVNPYKKFAESLIASEPTVRQQIKTAVRELNKALADGLAEAGRATTGEAAMSALDRLAEQARDTGQRYVDSARSGLNSAAQSLAGATSKSAAKSALKEVKRAQKDLAAAITNQKRLDAAAAIVASQSVITEGSVINLLNGRGSGGETLAEYAEARERLIVKINEANQKLADAISMRDQYGAQVAESVRTFGSLLTAQAQTINGIEQALTAQDITTNLSDRLEKIRTFQNNLKLLLAQGLNNAAYKQLVDAGVDGGSAYAEALLQGGSGAIADVNSLTDQIAAAADSLGGSASSRLYQAGVDAAQGLVDGLNSLGAQLDAAAARLGDSIAASLKRSLGIASPSRVAIGLMGDFGDGIETGLDNQHSKAISASKRLADQIRVSPEVAAYASAQGSAPVDVSGNTGPKVLWTGDIVTPTEDPRAVSQEVLDELAERLT